MHVLVTGANGFSGAEVTRALLARGHRVSAVVRSARERLDSGPVERGALAVVSGDLAGDLALPRAVDAVVHAAARSPAAGVTVEDIVRDNTVATRRLADYARRAGARTFVYFSSLSVYGRIDVPVVDEATPVVDPDAYGVSKRQGEQVLAADADAGHYRALAVRLPGVIGRASVRNWLTGVLAAAREGREIAIYNPDAPFNNAAHIADLTRLVCDVLEREWRGFDVVTAAAAGQTTVGAAVGLLVAAFGNRSRVRVEPAVKRGFLVSSARACARYGYQPMEISDMLNRFAQENAGG